MSRVLITGSTSGIGESLVRVYASKGFEVIATGRDRLKLANLQRLYPSVNVLSFDITQPQQVLNAALQVNEIDQLILNAGTCEYMQTTLPFDSNLFEQIIKTNLLSVGYCLEAFLPKLVSNGQVGIMSSSVTYLPFTQSQAYGASKAGLDYLAKTLSIDLEKHSIGVSLIQPGFVDTPLTRKNTFDMPNQVSSAFAASAIFKGMQAKKLSIRFPLFFIYILILMSLLPFALWRKIAISMVKK